LSQVTTCSKSQHSQTKSVTVSQSQTVACRGGCDGPGLPGWGHPTTHFSIKKVYINA